MQLTGVQTLSFLTKYIHFLRKWYLLVIILTTAFYQALREAHDQFKSSLSAAEADFNQLAQLDRQIKSFNVGPNPYTWFTMEALEDTWNNLQKIIRVRRELFLLTCLFIAKKD